MKITNIKQLLPFVENKAEFVVIDKGEFTVIDYVYQDKNTFDEPELMECRGIKFDREGLILARPPRKFFNYGERGADLPTHRPHVITEKMDGSLVHPTLLERRLFFHTRKGHTDVARKAERHVLSSPQHGYQEFCIKMLNDGYTPSFEYTGPNNRIVLRYEQEALTLFMMRHTIDGTVYPYQQLENVAKPYGVPVIRQAAVSLSVSGVEAFVRHTRALEDAEGYVIYFDDGYMVKIKAEDYVLKHRALDGLESKKKVVALCAQGFMDDVLPILSEEDANELIEFDEALQLEVNKLAQAASAIAGMVTGGTLTRKDFAIQWNTNTNYTQYHPRWLSSIIFGILDGRDARMLVLKAVEKHYDDIGVKWRGE